MAAFGEYSYSLIRFVPDVVRGEFVNIGAVVRDENYAIVAFTPDWSRLQTIFPDADVRTLGLLASEIHLRTTNTSVDSWLMVRKIIVESSNCLQFSRENGLLAESIEAGLDRVMALYVLTPPKAALFAVASGA